VVMVRVRAGDQVDARSAFSRLSLLPVAIPGLAETRITAPWVPAEGLWQTFVVSGIVLPVDLRYAIPASLDRGREFCSRRLANCAEDETSFTAADSAVNHRPDRPSEAHRWLRVATANPWLRPSGIGSSVEESGPCTGVVYPAWCRYADKGLALPVLAAEVRPAP